MQNFIDKYLKGDKVIWTVIILLSLYSIVMAYSSSSNLAFRIAGGNVAPYIIKHTLIILIGIILIIYLQFFPYKYFSRLSQIGIFVSIILLFITLLFGVSKGNASRWIMGFQPSDFAKLVLILYISRMLTTKQDEIKDFKKGLLPILWPVLVICGLILPADFSTAAMLLIVCFTMIFIGGAKIKHLVSIVGTAVVGFLFLILLNMAFPGLLPRVDTWEKRMMSYGSGNKQENYQAEMAKRAVANGFLFGKGPGRGHVKNDLYSAQSDFIYASSIEEFGSIFGGIGLLLLYMILFFRAIRIMNKVDSKFAFFLVFGLSFMLIFQSFINMGVGVNLLPVTGQPLPLISMGGTSILFTCISLGVILNVSATVYTDNNYE
ncbi:MAG: cell division protein FtsW [Crocinitomicaceae bacterium]|nr:cell division protein FtsW [Crocinitomicaceae bacterium]|tara:strand:- start:5921 stop:7048 length:1128 start_codon:yes stop_codon:yes gene_type:complete